MRTRRIVPIQDKRAVSFLNQLKTHAKALQSESVQKTAGLEENPAQTEPACRTVSNYLQDLAGQLNVIAPVAPRFTLDGTTPWPIMKLADFRVDSRKKMLRSREVFDYVAMGWSIVPQVGKPVG